MQATNTVGLITLAENANGRNRSVDLNKLTPLLDPEGLHLCTFTMILNHGLIRTKWLTKLINTMVPTEMWLDVDMVKFYHYTQDYKAATKAQPSIQ